MLPDRTFVSWQVWKGQAATKGKFPATKAFKGSFFSSREPRLTELVGSKPETLIFHGMGMDGWPAEFEFWQDLNAKVGNVCRGWTLVTVFDKGEQLQPGTFRALGRNKGVAGYSVATLLDGMEGQAVEPHHYELLRFWLRMTMARKGPGIKQNGMASVSSRCRNNALMR